MNTDLTPPPIDPPPLEPPRARRPPAPKSGRRYIPGLLSLLVGGFILLVLVVVAVPVFNVGCGGPSNKARAMARAKQISLALRLFAGDNDGVYPRAGLPGLPAATVRNSNEAFAMLFPAYATSEALFGNPLSAYQTRPPDEKIDNPYTGKPIHTLEPGENVYAYVVGLTEASNPSAPLIADGTDGTGHYTTDQKKRGGVWKGEQAMVVHLDSSAALETLAGPEHSRYIPRRPGEPGTVGGNLLDVSGFGAGVRLLDPAVDPRAKP